MGSAEDSFGREHPSLPASIVFLILVDVPMSSVVVPNGYPAVVSFGISFIVLCSVSVPVPSRPDPKTEVEYTRTATVKTTQTQLKIQPLFLPPLLETDVVPVVLGFGRLPWISCPGTRIFLSFVIFSKLIVYGLMNCAADTRNNSSRPRGFRLFRWENATSLLWLWPLCVVFDSGVSVEPEGVMQLGGIARTKLLSTNLQMSLTF